MKQLIMVQARKHVIALICLLATNVSCLENLQILVDSADSWLQYNELTAKWSVVINQSYTDYTTIDDLFLVDSSNLVGGINVSPINLNETFNQTKDAYPNQYIKDQIDYQLIELDDYQRCNVTKRSNQQT